MLAEQVVADHKVHHRLDHRNGTGEDTGIMATARGQLGGLPIHGDCLLNLCDRGGGLEGHPEEDLLAIADPTLNAAGTVGCGADPTTPTAQTTQTTFSPLNQEGIIMLASGLESAKPLPISNPLVAGRLIIALARSASSLSKTGSPRPAGTPLTTHSIVPPMLSPWERTCLIRSIILAAASESGQRTGVASTKADVTLVLSTLESISWIERT